MEQLMLLGTPNGRSGWPKRLFSLALAIALAIGVLAGTAPSSHAASASGKIVGISANQDHSLAVSAGGKVFSWGSNLFGQLGNGTNERKSIPSPISAVSFGGKAVRDVKAGHYHSLARTADGNLYAWGDNNHGELGDGTNAAKAVPVRVSAPDGVTFAAIEASYDNSFALTPAGKVYAWGWNYDGTLGIGAPCNAQEVSKLPVQVAALDSETITDISSKGIHCLALTDDGRVYAWGSNEGGRLGIGSGLGDRINLPVLVSSLGGTRITKISAGNDNSLALDENGKVYEWGWRTSGATATPSHISFFDGKGIVDIDAGLNFSVALGLDGKVYTWGRNALGQLGNGPGGTADTPSQVLGLGGKHIVSVAAGYSYVIALSADGEISAWGDNGYGQLGNGSNENSNTPILADLSDTAAPGGGNPDVNIDIDGDGVPDLNIDTNGDGRPDVNIDTDGDGIPDINIDTDGDGRPDLNIDTNGDGKPDLNIDTNGDGIPDLNIDTNGDFIPDLNVDLDGDGHADINIDTNDDGIADLNVDTTGDRHPDVNLDLSDDGIPDHHVDPNGPGNPISLIDRDGDGHPDVNIDTNNDGVPDLNIDTNDDGIPDLNIDTNGDGRPNLNVDTDGDGHPDINIDTDGDGKADINIDTNGDGKPNLNVDTDGDGHPDLNIDTNGDGRPNLNIDTDGDGKPDVNIDTDGDGIPDKNIDTDGDGIPDTNIDTGSPGGAPEPGGGGGDHPSQNAQIASFGVTQKTVYIKRGKTAKLPFIAYAAAAGTQSITWAASKSNVATVEKGKATGKLTVSGNADAMLTIKAGKKPGSGKITLTSANGKKLAITVKVVKSQKNVTAKSVKIGKLTQKAAKRLKAGQVKTLKAAFTKKATAIATWKSSNPKVAKIDAAGKLTTLAKGTAKITLKVGGKKKVIKITVK
jgi:alpha-tubulin suppressor-like RCC1 family protein